MMVQFLSSNSRKIYEEYRMTTGSVQLAVTGPAGSSYRSFTDPLAVTKRPRCTPKIAYLGVRLF
jgi:hypothetical protein